MNKNLILNLPATPLLFFLPGPHLVLLSVLLLRLRCVRMVPLLLTEHGSLELTLVCLMARLSLGRVLRLRLLSRVWS